MGSYLSVSGDRMRAAWWRLRGARLGRKARIGQNSAIVRPWCLETGERIRLERAVYIKIASDEGRIFLGEQVFLGSGAELDVTGNLRLGDHVLVAPGCFITDHHHRREVDERIAAQGCQADPVIIEDDVWLGANSVILAGVRVGMGAIVGAGAVVTRDVESMTIVAGVPAKIIGKRH